MRLRSVRATVNVDPHTAQLTVTNGALPTGKYGIPFQVKKVNVLITAGSSCSTRRAATRWW
jgi:hypothetical protein